MDRDSRPCPYNRASKDPPAGRHRVAAKGVLVHEQAKRAGMNRGPVTVSVLQAGGDLIPVDGLVRLQRILRLGLHAEGNAEIADIADGIALLGKYLRQRLTGILVVVGYVVVE